MAKAKSAIDAAVKRAVAAERRRIVRIVELYMDHLPEDCLEEIRAGGRKGGRGER